MDIRNFRQNIKAVKRDRDSRSQTKSKIKDPPTQISRQFYFAKVHVKSNIKNSALISTFESRQKAKTMFIKKT